MEMKNHVQLTKMANQTVDQNGNFHKFKMADGRHFENSFIFISQSELSYIDQIWCADANFHSEDGYLTKIEIFSNSRWRTDAILKIVFCLYLGAILADQREIWNRDEGSHHRCIFSDQNCNCRKFKMADGRHFETSFISISQPWIIRFRSNLVHIYKFPFRAWKFDIKSKFLKIQDGGQTPYWKPFLAIYRRHILRFMQISEWRWRITCR